MKTASPQLRILASALVALMAALWAGMAMGGGVALGQERQRTLPELLKARNEAMQRHHETGVELKALEGELSTLEKSLQAANEAVRRAEADGGPFKAQTVQKLRAKARSVAEQKVKVAMRHAELTPRHELQRVQEIEARSAYASRLMELAHRLGSARARDSREKTELALLELDAIAKLRKAGKRASDLKAPVAPLGPYATHDDMVWRAQAYERQIETFRDQIRELRPREEMITQHVRHLDRLVERGYALPELVATLERERAELTQVQELRHAIEGQTGYYEAALAKVRERMRGKK